MHALLALAAIALSAEPPVPGEAPRQGIHIEVRDQGDTSLVSIPDDKASLCQVRSDHPCFLSAEPGRRTFLVDGKRIDVPVHPGESEFQVEHPSHALAWIGGALLILGPPATLISLAVSYGTYRESPNSPWSTVWLYAGYAAMIATLAGLPMIIIDLVSPHTLLVPVDPAHPTALRIQLAPDVSPGRAALAVFATF